MRALSPSFLARFLLRRLHQTWQEPPNVPVRCDEHRH